MSQGTKAVLDDLKHAEEFTKIETVQLGLSRTILF